MIKSKQVYLSLGSNLGDRLKNLKRAIKLIKEQVGQVNKTSLIYKTKSLGFKGPNFFNGCVLIETSFPPNELLDKLLEIETLMGRIRSDKKRFSSRIIDIDILFYEQKIILTKKLKIPHPRLENRNFILYPMREIAPKLTHPVLKKTIALLTEKSSDNSIPLELRH